MVKNKISIIVPCFQERNYIKGMVDSVEQQKLGHLQIELIIIDGGSNDGTLEMLSKLKKKYSFLTVLHNSHQTIPYALNLGIRHADGEYIARMDVHAKYPENYLSTLYKSAIETKADNVGCCIETLPADHSSKSVAIAYALSHPFGVGNSHFRIGVKRPKEVDTVPFGFFKHDLFDDVGLFDTDMPFGEDHEFNARIKKAGKKIMLIPHEEIKYFARDTFKKLSSMMYHYGYSRPIANKKLGGSVNLRQYIPLLFVMSLFVTALFAPFNHVFLFLFMGIISVYLLGAVLSAVYSIKKKEKPFNISLCANIIISFLTSHFSYGFGYARGLLALLVHAPSPQTVILTR